MSWGVLLVLKINILVVFLYKKLLSVAPASSRIVYVIHEAMSMSVLKDVLPISSVVIGVAGSVTNVLSLSYFVRKVERTLSNRIFIVLNLSDFLLSLFTVISVSSYFCEGSNSICGKDSLFTRAAITFFDLVLNSSAFATCLLSFTRTISLCYPFYQIQKKAVGIAALIFLVQAVLSVLIRFYLHFTSETEKEYMDSMDLVIRVMIVVISFIIVVNLVSSVLSAWKLWRDQKKVGVTPVNQGPRTNTSQRATVTILIVTILFCFFNAIFCISLFFVEYYENPANDIPQLQMLLHGVPLWLAVPLNSAINPIIYFIRKKDMRNYIMKDLLSRFV